MYLYGDRVLVTEKTPVLKIICIGKPDATNMISSKIYLIPTPHLLLAVHKIHVLPDMEE